MVSERSLEVLRVIVQDYVASREPVGSKSIVERHSFGVSAATIRNDMALLEDEELIAAPHTSSGRIPTDKGYRLFVNHLADARPLSGAQRSAIQRFLGESVDLNDVLSRAVRLLAQLTNQVALAQKPSMSTSKIRHVELIALAPRRLLCVVIMSSGAVQQRTIEVTADYDDDILSRIRSLVNTSIADLTVAEASSKLSELPRSLTDDYMRVYFEPVCRTLLDQIIHNRTERFVMAGTANLVRTEEDFPSSITPVLDAIEEQVVLVRLFDEMNRDHNEVVVRIGRENQDDSLTEASVLSTEYSSGGGEGARLGLVGPLRMDYSGNMSAVRAVAHYLSGLFGD